MDETTRRMFDEMDRECLGAQMMAVGAYWPSIALALAMVDAGLIEKLALLKIIDSLHSVVLAWASDGLGDPRDEALGLERLREFLELKEMRPGQVLPELGLLERAEAWRHLTRKERPPRSG